MKPSETGKWLFKANNKNTVEQAKKCCPECFKN